MLKDYLVLYTNTLIHSTLTHHHTCLLQPFIGTQLTSVHITRFKGDRLSY
jgi:hypothetical protein